MNTKFCKDCKYSYYHKHAEIFICTKDNEPDLVKGEPDGYPCHALRGNADWCGREARWFKPKEKSKSLKKH